MKILMAFSIILMSTNALAENFSSLPPTLVAKFEEMKKQKPGKDRKEAFHKLSSELASLEKDLYEHPMTERKYDSVRVFELKGLFKNVDRKGLTPEGCKLAMQLMPYWSDPQLDSIDEAGESAQFTYAAVKAACAK